MTGTNPAATALRFRVQYGTRDIDCLVTKDAVEALGAAERKLSSRHRRFLEGIAAERIEWSRTPQSTIVIDAWDITTHRQD
ncbi:hypothetical protein G3545_14185 [Starkeya sp. ORNL1]|uniref:hypothetical protein n=1 Tax=Starkeya sp. ORNL1 TaxID=2709380 RepID=UPI001462E9CE|nr:hypothetical protein [Starkeya sp. ORNL1]QJP14692.1 hypothetical protein G3545_14185 [Starkeya sp. ORNL1]